MLAGTVELRNTLGRTFGLELPASLAFDCPSAAAVADRIATAVRAGSASDAAEGNPRPDPLVVG